MIKKFFTVEDLINFCELKKMYNFSSKESGEPIVVQSIQDFSDAEIEESDDGKLYAKVRVCHTLLNRNKSYITEESMIEAMPTLKYSPLLGAIHQLDDGTFDFHSHDMHTETDDNGNEYTVYDESQIGTFTADDPYLEYDKEKDKTYVVAKVAIPTEYTRAAKIIKEKGGTKVSCELLIYECSYNAKSKYLQLDHFRFNGCTCLGCEKDGTPIGEGMEGSYLSLENFSEKNNSFHEMVRQSLSNMQSILNNLDAKIDNKITKGGTDLKKEFEEESTEVEEVEETSSEETTEEATTANEEETSEEPSTEEETSTDEESTEEETEEEPTSNDEDSESTEEETFEQSNDMTRTFSISHEDIRCALYNLLAPFESEDNEWYYISSVFDTYFVYESWDGGKIFGQKYITEDDNVSFDGERYSLRKEYLTESEYIELQAMRENYAELKSFKEEIEKNELHEKREEIVNSETFSVLSQKDGEGKYINKDFEKLVEEMDNYSLADLETKIKVMHSDYISEHSNFAETKEEKKTTSVKLFGNIDSKPKKKRYGNLFQDNN